MASSTTSSFANFATLVGVYDGTLYNGVVLDTTTIIGNGDLNLNAANNQYLMNTQRYVSPAAITGNGMSFTGWFYPTGQQTSGAAIFDISSNNSNSAIILSLTSGATPNVVASYNGTSITSSSTIALNQWHFFTYIVDCSGSNALQVLYVDGAYVGFNSIATYMGNVTYNNSILGYTGTGSVYYNGKIDDFRYYNRVLTPPEISVLYRYNYQSTATALVPSVTVTKDTLTSGSNIVLDLSGSFSYVNIARTGSGTGNSGSASYNVSCASMIAANSFLYASWTDSNLVTGCTYTYLITPYILSNLGNAVSITVTI